MSAKLEQTEQLLLPSSSTNQPTTAAWRGRARARMSDPRYGYGYPAQGYHQGPYQGPPVMAPPQYQQYAQPPPPRSAGFLEGCLAALCCCCLLDECCCDPSIIFVT